MTEKKLEISDLEKIANIPYCSLKVDLTIGLSLKSNIEICHSSGTYIRSKIINYLEKEINKKQFNYLKESGFLVRFMKFFISDINPFKHINKLKNKKKGSYNLFLSAINQINSIFQQFKYKAKPLKLDELFKNTFLKSNAIIKYQNDNITIRDKNSLIGLEVLIDSNVSEFNSLDESFNYKTNTRHNKQQITSEILNHIKRFKEEKEAAEVGLYMFKTMWRKGVYFVTENEFKAFEENYKGVNTETFSSNIDVIKREIHRLELRNSLLNIFTTLNSNNNIINSIDTMSNGLQEVIDYSENIKIPSDYETFIKDKIIIYKANITSLKQKLNKEKRKNTHYTIKTKISDNNTKNEILKLEQKIIIYKGLEKSLLLGMGLYGFKTGITANYDIIQDLRLFEKESEKTLSNNHDDDKKYIKSKIKNLKKIIKREKKQLTIEYNANSKILSYIKTGDSDSIDFLQKYFGKTILYYNEKNNDLIINIQKQGIFKCVIISDKYSTKKSLYKNQHSPLSIINLTK